MVRYDVLVVGGGVVGLSAAIGMRSRGYTVAIIDAAAASLKVDPFLDPRVYALNHASLALLERQGALAHIDATYLAPYRHMHVWDAVQKAHIDFDACSIAEARLGVIVSDTALKQGLHRVCDADGIAIFASTMVRDLTIENDHICVYAGDKGYEADLLMIADGAGSTTRSLLDVSLTTWPYKQTAIVAHVQVEKPHNQTAYQVFRTEGPLAFLPLPDPYQCSIVWSTATAHAETLMNMSSDDFAAALADAFEHTLGLCHLRSDRYTFPLIMRHAQAYVGSHWMLLGDAAHTIHPLAGLGLNIGLADVATWLDLCDGNTQPLVTMKRLGRYQRERKASVWQMILAMEGLKTLFESSSAPIVALRGFGLSLCNAQSLLKRFFIHHAQGGG